eukprot:TRINITY_DN40840_c0_g1_i1.p1 TRINITY_DN40840_c0_g1~~TRINITY_DN40840_c0_g1_i1.p1  ORF type:complete len:249 (-),score=71.95 TRINITY_DN40840_c0_g1_i1:383-1129(-)
MLAASPLHAASLAAPPSARLRVSLHEVSTTLALGSLPAAGFAAGSGAAVQRGDSAALGRTLSALATLALLCHRFQRSRGLDAAGARCVAMGATQYRGKKKKSPKFSRPRGRPLFDEASMPSGSRDDDDDENEAVDRGESIRNAARKVFMEGDTYIVSADDDEDEDEEELVGETGLNNVQEAFVEMCSALDTAKTGVLAVSVLKKVVRKVEFISNVNVSEEQIRDHLADMGVEQDAAEVNFKKFSEIFG